MQVTKVIVNRLFYYSSIFVMVSFLLPFSWNNYALVFLIALAIIKKIDVLNFKSYFDPLFFFPALFCLLLVGMLYTSDPFSGWQLIERHLILLAAPFIGLLCKDFNFKELNNLKIVFILSCLISSFYCLSFALFDFWQTGSVYLPGKSGHFLYNKWMYHQLVEPIRFHAVYYSFYLTFASSLALYQLLFLKNSKILNVLYWLMLVIGTLMIFLLKSSIFAFLFPLNCLALLFLRYRKYIFENRKYKFASFFIFLFVGFLSFSAIQSKLKTLDSTLFISKDKSFAGTLSIRLGIWHSAWQAIKEEPFLGHGTGDSKDVLMKFHKTQNFTEGYENEYNAHNMYLQYWISNGLLAPIVFIGLLFLLLRMAIRNKNALFFLFILTFSIFSFTEATMMRQKGIVFFVFISTLFAYNPKIWLKSLNT